MKTTTKIVLLVIAFSMILGACAQAIPSPATPTPSASKTETAVAKKPVRIGYAAPTLGIGQFDIQETLLRYAKQKGWDVIVTDAEGIVQKQNEDINYLISLGVDAIVTVPQDSTAICAAVEKAKSARIPFYTIDRSPSGCAINMTLLSDNRLAGQQAGQALVDLLKKKYGSEKGAVLEITGDLGQNVVQLRRDGFHDIVDQYPDIKVIQKISDWNTQTSSEALRETLTLVPDLDAVYLHSDALYTAGTLAELKAANKLFKRGEPGHVILVSVDGSSAGLQAIKDGWADESSNQPIPDFGLIVEFIEKEMNGKPIQEGELKKQGALWSPAVIKKNADGTMECFLATTAVTETNVDNPGLWGNFTGK